MSRAVCAALVLAVCCTVSATAIQAPTRFVLASVIDSMKDAPVVGLAAEDFVVQEGNAPCEVLALTTAHYPVAILIDTSHAARTEFTLMRTAVRQLVSRLSGREVALYTFGERAFRVADFTRDTTRLERKVDDVFALAEGESHVLDGIVEAAKDLARREAAVAMIVVVSAGSNDQSNRTPREVFEPVLASRSIVHVVERRSIGASGRLGNVRGQRNFTSDRSAEAALGLQEVLQALVTRTRGDYDRVFAGSGFVSSLERLQQRLTSEVVVEYASTGAPAADLRIGTRVVGGVVRGIGLDRTPR